jgi:hypothetical protein
MASLGAFHGYGSRIELTLFIEQHEKEDLVDIIRAERRAGRSFRSSALTRELIWRALTDTLSFGPDAIADGSCADGRDG